MGVLVGQGRIRDYDKHQTGGLKPVGPPGRRTMDAPHSLIPVPDRRRSRFRERACLSCGTPLSPGRRRYCAVACRQRLRYKLQVRTGLLRALNTRFATFHFDQRVIALDLLTAGNATIFSFVFPRSPGRPPAEDFSRMADILGNVWWTERRRTNRHYLASRELLRQACRDRAREQDVRPRETSYPTVNPRLLVHLRIGRADLECPDLEGRIKKAFREQAKRHHPDQGGSASSFRKLRQAYEELLHWSDNPTFARRRGFPDKWFYDGETNRWVQPTPIPPPPI